MVDVHNFLKNSNDYPCYADTQTEAVTGLVSVKTPGEYLNDFCNFVNFRSGGQYALGAHVTSTSGRSDDNSNDTDYASAGRLCANWALSAFNFTGCITWDYLQNYEISNVANVFLAPENSEARAAMEDAVAAGTAAVDAEGNIILRDEDLVHAVNGGTVTVETANRDPEAVSDQAAEVMLNTGGMGIGNSALEPMRDIEAEVSATVAREQTGDCDYDNHNHAPSTPAI